MAIIGGGFAGLSAARRLRQIDPTLRVAVLEAHRLAAGTAGRNSGFMIDLPHDLTSDDDAGNGNDRSMIALNRQAIAFAKGAVQDYDICAAYFDPVGKVNGAASPATDALNRSYAAHLTRLGETSERLDAQAIFALTGSRHYVSGLYTPATAFARGGSAWSLTTPNGRVSAAKVILANNGHLESFGFAQNRLLHVFLYASMTGDLGPDMARALGGQPRWGVTPSDPMGTTTRRIDTALGGNRMITRTCASFRPGMQPSAADMRRAAAVHRQKFADRFPALRDVPQQYSWAGHLCLARNGVSVTGEQEPGLFAATVCNGLGTARSTLTGMAAAETMMGQFSAITAHFAVNPPPAKLPPKPFATLGANMFLRFREWRARAE